MKTTTTNIPPSRPPKHDRTPPITSIYLSKTRCPSKWLGFIYRVSYFPILRTRYVWCFVQASTPGFHFSWEDVGGRNCRNNIWIQRTHNKQQYTAPTHPVWDPPGNKGLAFANVSFLDYVGVAFFDGGSPQAWQSAAASMSSHCSAWTLQKAPENITTSGKIMRFGRVFTITGAWSL